MMYPYLTLDEDTEIVHSDMDENGHVKVYIEQADEADGFHSAVCMLPSYEWRDIVGFTDDEIKRFQQLVENNAHIILELSQCGGIDNAAGF
jgi:hypothetical protein